MCWLNRRMATRIWFLMGVTLGLIAAALYWLCRAYPTVPVQVRLTKAEMDAFYHFPRVVWKVVNA